MNIKGVLSRGYRIVQSGVIDFSLVRLKESSETTKFSKVYTNEFMTIVEFEVTDEYSYIYIVYENLLKEIEYHIREIQEDSEDYFSDCDEQEKTHIKTEYYEELKLIRDILA